MDDNVTAVGSVMLTDRGLLLVPTGPPNTDEPYDPLLGPHGDPDSELALSLHGHDLPSDGQRVAVTGRLSGQAIEVDHWRAEPIATSPWVADRPAMGVEPDVAQAILLDVPDHWRVIESGATKTMSGGRVANLTVERLTDEMRDWLGRQPEGAVRLSWFIADSGASAHQVEPASSARG